MRQKIRIAFLTGLGYIFPILGLAMPVVFSIIYMWVLTYHIVGYGLKWVDYLIFDDNNNSKMPDTVELNYQIGCMHRAIYKDFSHENGIRLCLYVPVGAALSLIPIFVLLTAFAFTAGLMFRELLFTLFGEEDYEEFD